MSSRPLAAINMVPFVDIMLVLLCIVLTSASFVTSAHLKLQLPRAEPARDEPLPRSASVEIDADGSLHFQGRPVDIATLQQSLGPLDRATPLLVRADRTLPLQRFVDVADLLKRLGFAKVALQLETRPA